MKQKARGGGGRKKKPLPSTEGTSSPGEGSPKEGTPGAEDTQASPSPDSSPAVAGGRTGDPFEEAEREEVLLIQRLQWSYRDCRVDTQTAVLTMTTDLHLSSPLLLPVKYSMLVKFSVQFSAKIALGASFTLTSGSCPASCLVV